MTLQVYGIPNCGTCKKALQWLDEHQIAHEFIDTKLHPPSTTQIAAWVKALGNAPLRNTSGQSYRALGDTKANWDDAQWVAAFGADAMLLKRPLFVQDGVAVTVGFRDAKTLREKLGA
jgi:arsenate reductase (glutaredoxin)